MFRDAAVQLPDRDPALAHQMVADGALLLDVRGPDEFAQGHLDGARNIPVEALAERLDAMRQWTHGDRGHGVVLYCRSGRRADRAKAILAAAGYTRVTNLGGLSDW